VNRMNQSKRSWGILLSALVCSITACGPNRSTNSGTDQPNQTPYEYSVPPEAGDGWRTASVSSVGMNEQLLVDLAQRVREGRYGEVHSIVIIKEGRLVFEEYWPGHDFGYASPNYHGALVRFDRNVRHNTHSATKSVASALVGIALDQGFIGSVDESVFRYLAPYESLRNEGRENITIEHLLKMASGLQWNEWDVSVSSSQMDLVMFNQAANPLLFLLTKPVVTTPGEQFYYNGGTVDLLCAIVASATGISLPQYSSAQLFAPLGITNYAWQTLYPSGLTCCHGDIYITPRDMAKLGLLYLDDGTFNRTQIISGEWVERSTRHHISPGVDWADGYGYLWWLRTYRTAGRNYDAFRADGWGGQQIVVVRDSELVVVFTGANYTTTAPCDEMMQSFILPALPL